jgi:hypothetical protein
MRIFVLLVVFVGVSVPTILEAEGERKETPPHEKKAAGEKKVKPACKRSDVAGLVFEVCLPENNIAGGPIACTVILTNTSPNTISYIHTTASRAFILEIKDPKGTFVPLTRYGKLVFEGEDLRFIDRKLKPGQSIELTYDLTRCFDLSMPDDYSLSAVSRQTWINEKKISVEGLKFSVKEN